LDLLLLTAEAKNGARCQNESQQSNLSGTNGGRMGHTSKIGLLVVRVFGDKLRWQIQGTRMPPPYTVTSVFWIAGNIIFDLGTGKTTNVLMLVNRESDATIFAENDARTYLSFVAQRAPQIQWYLDSPKPQRPQGWVIRGVQVSVLG
jgi:hypothetical protein